jgi:hypothetical protein
MKIVVDFNLMCYLWSTMLQKIVNGLILIAIDNDHLKNI